MLFQRDVVFSIVHFNRGFAQLVLVVLSSCSRLISTNHRLSTQLLHYIHPEPSWSSLTSISRNPAVVEITDFWARMFQPPTHYINSGLKFSWGFASDLASPAVGSFDIVISTAAECMFVFYLNAGCFKVQEDDAGGVLQGRSEELEGHNYNCDHFGCRFRVHLWAPTAGRLVAAHLRRQVRLLQPLQPHPRRHRQPSRRLDAAGVLPGGLAMQVRQQALHALDVHTPQHNQGWSHFLCWNSKMDHSCCVSPTILGIAAENFNTDRSLSTVPQHCWNFSNVHSLSKTILDIVRVLFTLEKCDFPYYINRFLIHKTTN